MKQMRFLTATVVCHTTHTSSTFQSVHEKGNLNLSATKLLAIVPRDRASPRGRAYDEDDKYEKRFEYFSRNWENLKLSWAIIAQSEALVIAYLFSDLIEREFHA